MTKEQLKKLHTIIVKLETLQRQTKDQDAKYDLGVAKKILMEAKSKQEAK